MTFAILARKDPKTKKPSFLLGKGTKGGTRP